MLSYSLNSPRSGFFIFSIIFLTSFFIISCNDTKKETKTTSTKVVIKQSFKDKVEKKKSENYMLMEYACLYCHKIENITAEDEVPSMKVVRDVYKKTYPDKKDFIKSFSNFCTNPTIEKSLMRDVVKQYGLVKDVEHSTEDLEEIAAYLFDYKF